VWDGCVPSDGDAVRVGHITKLIPDRKFGFIKTEHFRDDVFFHYSKLERILPQYLEEGMEVEFEINEILRMDEQKLEASLVQPSARPLSKALNEKLIPEMQAAHHPRARQRKPRWRDKPVEPQEESPQDEGSASDTQLPDRPTED
jgi:cold shock CspA family protein